MLPPPPRPEKEKAPRGGKKRAPKRAPKEGGRKPALPPAPLPDDATEAFAKFEPLPPEDEDDIAPFDNWGGFAEEFEAVEEDCDDAASDISYKDSSVTTEASDICDDEFETPDSPRAAIWSAVEKRLKPAHRASWRSSGARVVPDCDDDIF